MDPSNFQSAPQSAPSQNGTTYSTPVRRILVVDDNATLRDVYAMVLGLEDYETESASNGQEALELLRKRHFDLVITDRNMPLLGGVGLIRGIMAAGMEVPIIMISASLHDSALPLDVASRVAVALPKPAFAAQILAAAAFALHPDPRERRAVAKTRHADLLNAA